MQEYKVTVEENGTESWYQKGKFHRDNGPAVIHASGDEYWYQNGEYHREDGPAWQRQSLCRRRKTRSCKLSSIQAEMSSGI